MVSRVETSAKLTSKNDERQESPHAQS